MLYGVTITDITGKVLSDCEVPRHLAVLIAEGLGDAPAVAEIASDPRAKVKHELSNRGFKHYEPIETDYGHVVRVYESSSAMEPHIWLAAVLRTADCRGGLEPESAHVHMTIEQAERVRDALDACIANHYQNEG